MAEKKLRVGVIGAGEVFQVCHGPCLLLLQHRFVLVSICDVSRAAVDHCAAKFGIPHKTTDPAEVLSNPDVDVVLVLTSDDSHAPLTIAAVQAGKFVLVEKPLTLSRPAAEAIVAAEKAAADKGGRIFVGYMRRYAPSFLQAFRREVATIPRILYARVRDFSGPNASFVSQSGTFPVKTGDDIPPEARAASQQRLDALFAEAFPGAVEGADITDTDAQRKYWRFLGSLGSHDLSLMREALGGRPERVVGVSVHDPFYSAIFAYRNADGTPFSVTYESGIDRVPVFDAHLAVYGERKRVSIHYDSPYVKALPITVEVDEVGEHGEVQHRTVLSSYQDAYTSELLELYECAVHGKPIKTTAADALEDISLYDEMYKAWAAQEARA